MTLPSRVDPARVEALKKVILAALDKARGESPTSPGDGNIELDTETRMPRAGAERGLEAHEQQ